MSSKGSVAQPYALPINDEFPFLLSQHAAKVSHTKCCTYSVTLKTTGRNTTTSEIRYVCYYKRWTVKFDHQLATYLYKNKSLQLEGIGTFTLDEGVVVPNEQDKEVYYPIEGLAFVYDPKHVTEESLIKYLVEKLGKITPLVRSDLESYLSNIKQFLNLGKPYTIEGVGTLSKNNHGDYEFTPGNFLPVKEELNPRRENEEHNYPPRNQDSNAGRIFVIVLIIIAALAALGGIGWGVTNLIANYQNREEVQVEQQGYADTLQEPAADTAVIADTTSPAMSMKPDSARLGDTLASYKMVFEVTRYRDRAITRSQQLNTFGSAVKVDTITVRDSIRYRLYLPMKVYASDTARVRDSLSILFGAPVKIMRPRTYVPKPALPKPKPLPVTTTDQPESTMVAPQ